MKPKLVTTEQAHYKAGEWSGQNDSGLIPIGDSVLVLPDEASDKLGEKGLLVATPDQVKRQSLASETGVMIAVGDGAFAWSADGTRPFKGRKPEPGERIHFARYAGRVLIGSNGQTFRVMTDTCIAAIEG